MLTASWLQNTHKMFLPLPSLRTIHRRLSLRPKQKNLNGSFLQQIWLEWQAPFPLNPTRTNGVGEPGSTFLPCCMTRVLVIWLYKLS